MQAVPVEQIRVPIPYAAGNKTDVTHWKEPVNREEEKRDSIPSIRQNDKTGNRHSVCDNEPNCTAVGNELSITIRNSTSPITNIVRTRLWLAVCWWLRIRTDI